MGRSTLRRERGVGERHQAVPGNHRLRRSAPSRIGQLHIHPNGKAIRRVCRSPADFADATTLAQRVIQREAQRLCSKVQRVKELLLPARFGPTTTVSGLNSTSHAAMLL